jgi:hypothetical protein
VKDRTSFVVKIGRIYQRLSLVFRPIDDMLASISSKKLNEFPVICILACPRSGSTLTYQVLTTGIESVYLSNVLNLLYATPYLGSKIADYFTSRHISSFNSTYGFASGMAGEAEGLQFWSYWTGQLLDESMSTWNSDRAFDLKRKLLRILKSEESFITGYLGHVFCIQELRNLFPKIVFVYLQRNLVENAYSLFSASPDKWFSTKPVVRNSNDNYIKIARQLLAIHYSIFTNRGDDYVTINFDNLKRDPSSIVERIKSKCQNNGIHLKYSISRDILYGLSFSGDKKGGKEKEQLKLALLTVLYDYKDKNFIKIMESLIYE